MTFPPEKKVVRDGDAMEMVSASSAPALKLPAAEVPFVGHTGLLVVQRQADASVAEWYHGDWARRVVALDGVHGVVTARSSRQEGTETDLVLFEGDAGQQTKAIRTAAPHHPAAACPRRRPIPPHRAAPVPVGRRHPGVEPAPDRGRASEARRT